MAIGDIEIDKHLYCYNGNHKLKRANVKIPYTEEQIKEFTLCMADPIYFIKNYVWIVNLDVGLMKFELYDYQEEMIRAFSENRFNIDLLSRQMGKCVSKDINIRIRNKKTGDVYEIAIGKFFEDMQKSKLLKSSNPT